MYIVAILIAYLLGAVPFGLIVARWYGIRDIRKEGSGNIGATNVTRVIGFKAAIWVYLGDIGKGVLAMLLARYIALHFGTGIIEYNLFLVIVALAAVMGHVFPVYIGFKGGKGVSIGLGVMVVLLPYETLLALGIFILTILLTRYVSVGSMLAGISLFIIVALEKYWISYNIAQIYFYLTLLLAILVIITHRQNIGRLLSGTENRLKFKSDAGKAGSNA